MVCVRLWYFILLDMVYPPETCRKPAVFLASFWQKGQISSVSKAELLQLNRTQFPSLGIFVSKKVGNRKN